MIEKFDPHIPCSYGWELIEESDRGAKYKLLNDVLVVNVVPDHIQIQVWRDNTCARSLEFLDNFDYYLKVQAIAAARDAKNPRPNAAQVLEKARKAFQIVQDDPFDF